jgi:hypothetical protein
MIWHIFKKDWKLTWPLVLGVAFLNLLAHITQYKMGHFGGNPALGPLLHLLRWSQYIGSILVIAAVVHQDPTPGVRQDWLVRPIKRSDLLLEKLVFVLLLVQGPMLATDILRALLEGFSFHQSLPASFSRALVLLFALYLPALAFASLTKNFTEAIVAGVVAFLGGACFSLLLFTLVFGGQQPRFWVEWSGLAWINQSERGLLGLTVGVAILGLQYFRRNTLLSRWLFGGGVLLWVATLVTPWQPAFAVQERLSTNRGAAKSLELAFDASAGKLASIIGTNLDERRLPPRDSGDMLVGLPLHVTGWPDDTMLKADRSEMGIMGDNGKWLSIGQGEDLELRNEGPGNGTRTVHHLIRIPADLYVRFKDTPVQMEIRYSLTLLRLSHSFAIPALHGDQRMVDIGWCKTRTNDARTSVQLSCLQPGLVPNCGTVFLENPASGQRNPVRSACGMHYSPFVDTIDGDAVTHFAMTVPFRDTSGLAHYPVDGSQLADARVVMRLYNPVDHFSRRVVIPSIRLSDWVTQ